MKKLFLVVVCGVKEGEIKPSLAHAVLDLKEIRKICNDALQAGVTHLTSILTKEELEFHAGDLEQAKELAAVPMRKLRL